MKPSAPSAEVARIQQLLEQLPLSRRPPPGWPCSRPGCPNDAVIIDPTLRDTAWCVGCAEANNVLPPKVLAQSDLNRIAQDMQDLREALRPFAAFADLLPPVVEGAQRLTDSGPAFTCGNGMKEAVITFAHLRNALALLERLDREERERAIQFAEERMRR